MKNSDEPHCEFGLALSHVERDAMRWLTDVTEKIAKNPKSCNRKKAAVAASVLRKMQDAIYDMHADLHIADDRISEMSRELDYHDLVTEVAKRTSTEGLN